MYYVRRKVKNKETAWGIVDTTDNIEEFYTYSDIMRLVKGGVSIYGASTKGVIYECSVVDDLLLVPDVDTNSILVLNDNYTVVQFDLGSIENKRNDCWLASGVSTRKVKDGIVVSFGVCVKYDIEFFGTYMFKINNYGFVLSRLDDVIFTCGCGSESYAINKMTGGDCPLFLTEKQVNSILKSKGML